MENFKELKKPFCILPWMHMYLNPVGDAYPCCISNAKGLVFGSTKSRPITELWNSEEMKRFRLDLLEGRERPEICNGCYSREDAEGWSHRTQYLEEYKHLIEGAVSATRADGSVPEVKWAYLDFRLSNVCNFKCRSCGPEYSNGWTNEFRRLGLDFNDTPHTAEEKRAIFDFYLQQVPHLEKVYFAGGEPLLIKEHYELLEEFLRRGRTDVRLAYNTNLSRLSYGQFDAIEFWNKFRTVDVWPSVDHFGPKAEYMRKGTVWTEICDNMKRIRLEAPHVNISPTITISVLNVMDLGDLLDALLENQFLLPGSVETFIFNFVRNPSYLHISVLTEDLKQLVREKMAAQKKRFAAHPAIVDRFNYVLTELEQPAAPNLLAQFKDITKRVDEFRGESFEATFPLLAPLMAKPARDAANEL